MVFLIYCDLFLQGLMQNHEEIVEYFNSKGVSAIFLFRRNLLRRMVSILANSYDQNAKLLNGTHKSHVHSPHEVTPPLSMYNCIYIYIIYHTSIAQSCSYVKEQRSTLRY